MCLMAIFCIIVHKHCTNNVKIITNDIKNISTKNIKQDIYKNIKTRSSIYSIMTMSVMQKVNLKTLTFYNKSCKLEIKIYIR